MMLGTPVHLPIAQASRFTCMGCKIRFDTLELQKEHFKTEWHLYNLKRRVCNLETLDKTSFDQINANNPKKTVVEKRIPVHTTQESDDEDDDWEDESFVDDEEEDIADMLANVIPPNICLFCAKKNKNPIDNVAHMNLMHGFFIPEDQYLIDLDGMLEYLGFKVGAGATCLWCNKQFTSLHGVRLHMLYKDHCKIVYDQEKAVEEFKEFYDYTGQEKIAMKPLKQLAIPRKKYERRYDHNRALAKVNPSESRAIIAQKRLAYSPHLVAGYHKFSVLRAKNILKVGMNNNFTMRSRLREQNPK